MTHALETRAQMSSADINDLPDSAFAYIEPGGTKDAQGKTVPRSLRHFPIHDAAHVRNALARIGQGAEFGEKAMPKVRKAAQKMGIGDYGQRDVDTGEYRRVPDTVTRGFDFEMRSTGDGRTLEGYVAMFGSVARIPDRGGDFDEELHPGFADRSLANGYPVMQWDHGKDPRVGTVPIGVYNTFDKDSRGYYVRGRLFDNAVVEPVRQAIEGRAVKGMSFRFSVKKPGGDRWNRRSSNGVDKRDILDADVHEAGPVVFPAYAQTSVTVRSLLASASEEDRQALIEELADAIGASIELPYPFFTGQRDAWSDRGGESDDESWEDEASTSTTRSTTFANALAALRRPIILP
jgi:HK97 family phage prohead protease